MNKYQEALNRITKTAFKNETLQSDLECFYKLQELVNKETPMKPFVSELNDEEMIEVEFQCCDNGYACEKDRMHVPNYCDKCGQKIDWSDEQ